MQLNLTTWQRVMLMRVIGELNGPAGVIRKGIAVLDRLDLTPEEKEAVGWQQLPDGQAVWKDTERRWEIVLPDDLGEFVKAAAKRYNGWPMVNGRHVLDLLSQLGVEDGESAK